MSERVDAIVIGSGPGGEGAAMQLVKNGKKVVLFERHSRVGGGCTHWGTIPSKALRFSIYRLTEALNNPLFEDAGVNAKVTVADLRKSAQAIIDKQVQMRGGFYGRNDVKVVQGHARFTGPNTIVADNTEYSAEHIVLATGSRPYRPENIDFSHPRVFDSDTILDIAFLPQSMTVLGAGVIGCEYASMFRNLRTKINLVNGRDELLDFLDDEISDALGYHMRERGVVIRHNENF